MDKNTSRPASDAEWYCQKNPERERFYEIFPDVSEVWRAMG